MTEKGNEENREAELFHLETMLGILEKRKGPEYDYYLKLAKKHRLKIMYIAQKPGANLDKAYAKSILGLLRKK